MVVSRCYRAEIVFVQLEIAHLHVDDRSFRVAKVETSILFGGILVNFQSLVSKLAASDTVKLKPTLPCSLGIALWFCMHCTIACNEGYIHRERQYDIIRYSAHSHLSFRPDVCSRYGAFAQ